MKKVIPELRKEVEISSSKSDTGNLAEAVKWVYKRYGTDLSAFFRDAYKDAARKQQERAVDDKIETYSS